MNQKIIDTKFEKARTLPLFLIIIIITVGHTCTVLQNLYYPVHICTAGLWHSVTLVCMRLVPSVYMFMLFDVGIRQEIILCSRNV